jgi:hypothetical protein
MHVPNLPSCVLVQLEPDVGKQLMQRIRAMRIRFPGKTNYETLGRWCQAQDRHGRHFDDFDFTQYTQCWEKYIRKIKSRFPNVVPHFTGGWGGDTSKPGH